MHEYLKNIGIVIFFLLFVITNSFSINRQFTTYQMSSGLAHNTVWCIIQDSDGYMWVGTRDGLSRFDGKRFKTFKHVFGDSTSISNNHVTSLMQDQHLDIWVGTVSGLSKYNKQTKEFTSYDLAVDSLSIKTSYVRSIVELNEKDLLVGTTDGLYVFDRESETYDHYLVDAVITSKSNGIRTIIKDSRGNILIGTNDGLFLYEKNRFQRISITGQPGKFSMIVRTVKEDSKGILWVGTEKNGVFQLKYNGQKPRLHAVLNIDNSAINSNSVRSVFFENDSIVWIGTFEGINVLNTITGNFIYHTPTSLNTGTISHNSVHDIQGDAMGGVWVATYFGGINYYNSKRDIITHYSWFVNNQTKNSSNIVSVLKQYEDQLWIGTEGGGLYISNDNGATITDRVNNANSNLPHNSIKSLEKGNNEIWIGTLAGLSNYDLNTQTITNYFHDSRNANSLISGHVTAIHYVNDEQLIIGTNASGIQFFNPVARRFSVIDQLVKLNITCFFADSANRLWIGTENDVLLYDLQQEKVINISDLLQKDKHEFNFVSFIFGDSQGNIWIGTQGTGLYLIRNEKIHWFNTSNGLSDNTVNSMLEGDGNNYWLATNNGLARIELLENHHPSLSIISSEYSQIQGLQGLQFSPNSALAMPSGQLIFGGINGLNIFRDNEIKMVDFQPNIILEELKIDNQTINVNDQNTPLSVRLNNTEHLKLKYSQRNFSISFSGINFINAEKNIYRYRVEGLDNKWVELKGQNVINFNYFPSGSYEFKLQVTTNPEQWSEDYRVLKISVLPPWWKTSWAFAFYLIVLGILLTVFIMLSDRWVKLKNELSMQQFTIKKEKELHQLKLNFYTDVSHELRTPLTLILAPLENIIEKTDVSFRFRNQLIQIQRSGYRLMQLINQILDLRKIESGHERLEVAEGDIIRFLSEITLAFKEIARTRNVKFEFMPQKNQFLFWFDRNKLEIIINNLLSNAFKFTQSNGKVILQVEEVSGYKENNKIPELDPAYNYIKITVLNEGEGISNDQLQEIYKRFYSGKENTNFNVNGSGVGLELTKRMVELHRGAISVISKNIRSGINITTFAIYLPLEKNIYSSDEINTDFKNSEDVSLYSNDFIKRETGLLEENNDIIYLNENEYFEKILVVEDNPEVRNFVRDFFADKYEVVEAENGKIAFDKAVDISPALIISDVMMPVMDGIKLCKKIKTDPRTSHIPVILLTARTAVTFKYEGLETGADDYVTKPFSTKYLALRVKNLIKQRKQMQEHFKRQAICDPGSITLTSVDEKIVKKAVEYITKNIADTSISVTKISEYVGLSRVHFYRKIKAITNQTAVEFIRDIRLKRAASLLEQNKLTIKEIKNMVGFEDPDYFRDCFKEKFGVPPSQYSSRFAK